jgi:hypothetical protein
MVPLKSSLQIRLSQGHSLLRDSQRKLVLEAENWRHGKQEAKRPGQAPDSRPSTPRL